MRFPIFVRRLHLYLGIALLPWFFMYAISAFVLNHRPLIDKLVQSDKPEWTLRFQREYHRPVTPGANLQALAAEILQDMGLNRSFWVSKPRPNQVDIHAFKFLTVTRVRYFVDEQRVVAEDQAFRADRVLVRMHERSGFRQHHPWLTKVWALVVDLVALALITWTISGLYVWWKGGQQRTAGTAVLIAGLSCFVVLILLL